MTEKPLTKNIRPGRAPLSLKEYEAVGGYLGLRRALKEMSPKDVQKVVTDSNLRGRGGAGFQTGQKWSFVPVGEDAPRPKYLICNADEMEPGTFKDRLLMEGNPHQLLEGMIISSYAIQADVSYIFLRWAYKVAAARLERAIAEAYENNYLGKNIVGSGYSLEMYIHTSAGRYICGEETALLNALEGKRATPRSKPPFPQVCGLWGKPTVVNNVETLSNISHIVSNGPDWFKGLSVSPDSGTKIYGASGRVKRPGLWELPMGVTMRELLEEHAGGMRDGFRLRSVIPGGASTEFLAEEHLDVKMDYASVQKAGSRLGTGTMIVIDDKTCPIGAIHNLEVFFARESCGWCTPCREGLRWAEQILLAIENGEGEPEDTGILEEQCRRLVPGNTFCALAPGAVEPLQSGLKIFREDFERHIREKRCPWK
ncbi:MAG: NADH-quinone oxidoreductase subunit NuoF [Nitrospiraceae bacterium]|nr:NADH-quinone oxidoreductase subunit NuoF [Nitrospiraceae bacterium]